MAKRRSNHEGTIYKLANGSFRVQIRLNGRRLSLTAKTQKGMYRMAQEDDYPN